MRRLPGYSEYDFEGIQVFTLNSGSGSGRVLFYVPGGGFMKAMKPFHWFFLKGAMKRTGARIVVAQYPRLPFHDCRDVYPAIVDLYRKVASENGGSRMILAGDSSGGNIALRLAEYLALEDFPQPDELILMAPASGMYEDVDMDMLRRYERTCPFIGIEATIALGEAWLGGPDVTDPDMSPLYGVTGKLRNVTLIAGTRDLMFVSAEHLDDALSKAGVEHRFVIGRGLNHVYPLYFTPSAYRARRMIYRIMEGRV